MTYFEKFLKTNQAYADLHDSDRLPQEPKPHVAIVTCMDPRLQVAQALGLVLGEAHVLRNAGGRVTDDMIRSLVISQQQLGTREIIVLHHTDCGAQSFTNIEFAKQLEKTLAVNAYEKDFLPFSDVDQSVRDDINILKASPFIPTDIVISGAVYDVHTGRIREVKG